MGYDQLKTGRDFENYLIRSFPGRSFDSITATLVHELGVTRETIWRWRAGSGSTNGTRIPKPSYMAIQYLRIMRGIDGC